MSAVILPFKGKLREPEMTPYPAEARALHDARLIAAAKRENDDWTARMLLVLLQTLSAKQRELMEFHLLGVNGIDGHSTAQALAIVQLANGNKAHREAIKAALSARFDGKEGGQ